MRIVTIIACTLLCITTMSEAQIIPVYHMDDFKENTKAWWTGNGNNYRISIKQNHLEISNGSLGSIQSFNSKVNFPDEKRYAIETRYMIIKNFGSGSISLRCGMGNGGKDFISFTIQENVGKYKISAFSGKKSKEKILAKWKPAPFFNKGGYNVLTIERDIDQATFRLNGAVLKVISGIDKYWAGDEISIKAGSKVTAMFDAVAVYGFHNLTDRERGQFSPLMQKHRDPDSFARDYAQWSDAVGGNSDIPFDDQVTSNEVKSFFLNFQPMRLPYSFDYTAAQGREITDIDTRNRSGRIYALGEVATCADRKVVLILNRYTVKGQDVSRFQLESYDATGKALLADKEIAITVKENGAFFKFSNWNAYADGSRIIFQSSTKLSTGSTSSKTVTVNKQFCTY